MTRKAFRTAALASSALETWQRPWDLRRGSQGFDVLKGKVVRLKTGQTTQIGNSTAENVARMLLRGSLDRPRSST